MNDFTPDYRNIVTAAENKKPSRLPLYEHQISEEVISKITGNTISNYITENEDDLKEYFRLKSNFLIEYGYDVHPIEVGVVSVVQDGKGLTGEGKALFKNNKDIEKFDWQELVNNYIKTAEKKFTALKNSLPPGMKAIGGAGNGIFELAQDFIPLTELALLKVDDPEAYKNLWINIGNSVYKIWEWLLENYGDTFAVCRFGDDLGFKSSTLIHPDDIKNHIIPEYKKIVNLIHSYKKPFLLHSCGAIFEVMDDIIDEAKIDAKHSNEDQIAPFKTWIEKYGDRIGNFGGIEMNVLCLKSEKEIKKYVNEVLKYCGELKGIAIGSGNQISSYLPPEGFIAMTEAVREYRKD